MNENTVNNELDTQPEENGAKAEKVFTQEEVNKIVSDRLERERAKAAQSVKAIEEEREAELTARENKITCKEYLLANNYPLEMLDSLDTSDPETFKNTADSIYTAISNKIRTAPCKATPRFIQSDNLLDIGAAFGNSLKHTPKGKYPGSLE